MNKAAVTLVAVALFAACSSPDREDDAPSLIVTISGEGAAQAGFAFPPASSNDLAFVDGWDVRFERILVTVGDITLSDAPDANPTDQAQTGRVLATAKGPWAVDVTKRGVAAEIEPRASDRSRGEGSWSTDGKDPRAQLLARFDVLDEGRGFDPARRYAFGFDVIGATAAAERTNLDAAAEADYAEMIDEGISVLYVGTATFKGTDCSWSDPAYEAKLPPRVHFRLGFKTPTSYKNCQNSDLHGRAFAGEEAQRGVQVRAHGGTVAQITLHVGHPFWNTVDHDAAELFFDQMAAAASPDGALVLDDLAKVDFTGFKDGAGEDLPWRSCVAEKPVKPGARRFDAASVAVDRSGASDGALRSYADYVAYQQSTQGHLNADGLCAIERRFAAPR